MNTVKRILLAVMLLIIAAIPSSLALTQDTSRIIYLATSDRECPLAVACEIDIITPDGNHLQTIYTDLLKDPSGMDISPDGNYFLNANVVVDLTNGDTTVLGEDDLFRLHYAWSSWSPVEDQIAYTVWDLEGPAVEGLSVRSYELFLTDREQVNTMRIDGLYIFGAPAWSPDGTQIAIGGTVASESGDEPFRLYIIDVETGEYEPIYEFEGLTNPYIEWSPDQTNLVFSSAFDPAKMENSERENQIMLLELESGTVTPLTEGIGEKYLPKWSPVDENQLVFYYRDDETITLRLIDLDAQETTTISDQLMNDFDWSPDGESIAFITGEEDAADLCILDVEQQETTCLNVDAHWLSSVIWME